MAKNRTFEQLITTLTEKTGISFTSAKSPEDVIAIAEKILNVASEIKVVAVKAKKEKRRKVIITLESKSSSIIKRRVSGEACQKDLAVFRAIAIYHYLYYV